MRSWLPPEIYRFFGLRNRRLVRRYRYCSGSQVPEGNGQKKRKLPHRHCVHGDEGLPGGSERRFRFQSGMLQPEAERAEIPKVYWKSENSEAFPRLRSKAETPTASGIPPRKPPVRQTELPLATGGKRQGFHTP